MCMGVRWSLKTFLAMKNIDDWYATEFALFIDTGIKPVNILLSPQATSILVRVACVFCVMKTSGKQHCAPAPLPLSPLLRFTKTMATKSENLAVSDSVPPFTTITKKFTFLNALGIGSDPTNGVAPYTWRSS